jgi:ribosomal protein S18 acetylase RimI-like enzyme
VVPVLTVLGPAAEAAPAWREALAEIREATLLFAVCKPEHRAFVETSLSFVTSHPMFRMRLVGTPADAGPATRLGAADLAALRGLYEDGAAREEIPDFFEDSMVDGGIYYGVRDAGELVAAAGTHVLTPGAAAVGNVYVRHDARRRGLAARVTAAVARELRERGIETIVLNVRQDNTTAIRVYERLGFVMHGEFLEGFARPRA